MQTWSGTDTIAAIATARGLGGIGIIRISGSSALLILQSIFHKQAAQPPKKITSVIVNFTPRLLTHGWILDAQGKALDEVLAVYMPGPQTFSGEDIAEIHCHGGRAVLDAVLESVLNRGARLAQAGEFTRRAYLNGRMDLSQAEAVAEMISAPTREGVYLARNKLEGRLGETLGKMREQIDWLRASLYASIDFPDDMEEEDSGTQDQFQHRLAEIQATLEDLVQSHDRARLWREGALVVLAGEVNVGKSSLLNAMLGRRRALVSDIPGTTRDFIEENISLNGLPVRLVDTAGLREAGDSIEAEGIVLARELFNEADLVLLLLDNAETALSPENAMLMAEHAGKIFIALNKSDLRQGTPVAHELHGCPSISISAKTGQGLSELSDAIYKQITSRAGGLNFEQAAPPSLRQRHLLARVSEELARLSGEYSGRIPPELLSVRLDEAAALLADVIGLSNSEEILDKVFSSFCIGK